VAQRVLDQAGEQPLDQRELGAHAQPRRRRIEPHLERDAAPAGVGLEGLHDVVGELGNREVLGLGLDAAAFEAGQLEQVGDEAAEPLALPHRGLQVVARLGAVEAVLAQQQQLEIALHRGERRAQVVRDVRQQLAAPPRRVGELGRACAEAVAEALDLRREAADVVVGAPSLVEAQRAGVPGAFERGERRAHAAQPPALEPGHPRRRRDRDRSAAEHPEPGVDHACRSANL
jgi:pyruvate,water dikinase